VGLPNDTLSLHPSAPFSFDGEFRRLWFQCKRNIAGSYLQPLGFFQYFDMSGTDPSQWKLLKVNTFCDLIQPLINIKRLFIITKYFITRSLF
jgi:hypothetical protein